MSQYFVDVLLPTGEWWTVCRTTSRTEAREFQKKQKLNGCKTHFYKKLVSAD